MFSGQVAAANGVGRPKNGPVLARPVQRLPTPAHCRGRHGQSQRSLPACPVFTSLCYEAGTVPSRADAKRSTHFSNKQRMEVRYDKGWKRAPAWL